MRIWSNGLLFSNISKISDISLWKPMFSKKTFKLVHNGEKAGEIGQY